jgi:membrane protein
VFTRLLEYSSRLLENTSGGVIAGVGAIFLIWSVFRILDLAEQAFNDIWEIDRGRPLGRKLSDYLSIMLVSPVLIVTSSSAVVLLATKINVLLERLGLGLFAPVITLGLAIVPYVLIWLLLTFVYVFLPNTKVKPLSGLIGGIMAGTAFVLVQWGYINFQVGVASYNAIYGSFAALPLFLIWLNISWFIVLFGVEIVYAHQNQETYGFERVAEKISHSQWTLLSLQVAHLLVKNFRDGDKPLEVSRVCADLKIPHGIVSGILDSLAKAGLAVAIPVEGTDMKAYQPAKDTDLITVASVIEALEESGVSDIPVARTPAFERIEKSLEEFARLTEGSDANLRLKDI